MIALRSSLVIPLAAATLGVEGAAACQQTRLVRPDRRAEGATASEVRLLDARGGPLAATRPGPWLSTDGIVVGQPLAPKRPWLAGTLSLLIPFGAGSFYAAHPRHGAVHLVLGATTGTVTVVLASQCLDSCTTADQTAMAVAFVGFVGNWAVSIVRGVADANAFNRRLGPTEFAVALAFVAVGNVPERRFWDGDGGSLGLRLARLTF
jgi:hypothetical protein